MRLSRLLVLLLLLGAVLIVSAGKLKLLAIKRPHFTFLGVKARHPKLLGLKHGGGGGGFGGGFGGIGGAVGGFHGGGYEEHHEHHEYHESHHSGGAYGGGGGGFFGGKVGFLGK